ncbi:SDR family oxidoreductase [Actinoplanes sp. KI2]|uniref:SDR family oxidoreductase n=1 Tax=Actinoplanes sp. KI2 TaxID=2983315 RepID=UPI0021D57BA4|nr:SDR family oxidoreductase [Actinoplanes sp. KI2]MCU7728478.1 SDR family oxidoreductase [Actinoplanes sp. KI2]
MRGPLRRNILVTGASGGLGLGMAREFAARGRNLALCARRADRLAAVRAELLERHPDIDVRARRLDVTDPTAVATVFRGFHDLLGGLDRVVVNAGTGAGVPVGTGGVAVNRATAETNFLGALAQCEAAMEIFREQGYGHLVVIASVSALKGFPGGLTVYAASKAAALHLADGIRADVLHTDIRVSAILPGYIRSESNPHTGQRLARDTADGCRLLVRAIEREPARACVPAWPWSVLGLGLRIVPLRLTSRVGAVSRRASRPPTSTVVH